MSQPIREVRVSSLDGIQFTQPGQEQPTRYGYGERVVVPETIALDWGNKGLAVPTEEHPLSQTQDPEEHRRLGKPIDLDIQSCEIRHGSVVR